MDTVRQEENEFVQNTPEPNNTPVKAPLFKRIFRGARTFIFSIATIVLVLKALSWIGIDLITPIDQALSQFSGQQKYVDIVREGHFASHQDQKVGEAFDKFFGSPRWSAFDSDTGEKIVEFTGDCTYLKQKVKARMQFVVKPETGSFEIHTIGFNDIPQNKLIQAALLAKVFEDKEIAPAEKTSEEETAPSSPPLSTTETQQTPSSQPASTQQVQSQPTTVVSGVVLADGATRAPLPGLIEWKPGQADVTLPLDLGGDQAELRLGLGHPNGIKCQVVLNEPAVGWDLDISQADTSFDVPYDETGELREGFVMQAAAHDFDEDGTPEIIVTAGDGLVESYAWVFSYNKVADPSKLNPFVQDVKVTGQTNILVEKNKLLLPYGSQGLVEEYAYVDKQFYKK